MRSRASSRGAYRRYDQCVTCLPSTALLIVPARDNDKSSGLIFIALVVAIAAFYYYSGRRAARPIRINQGWYTLEKLPKRPDTPRMQTDTPRTQKDTVSPDAPPAEGAADTTDSDSIPADTTDSDSITAVRRAYCAAELRGAKTLLSRGGKNVNVRKTKARIRELEAQLQPA
ncbi:hypothetical protein B0H16DRAFT_1563109 [Mycena metata]|uniref:Uncharacterized protein n=1 Tax=Mycena metata TaxID=1033252 RepID=A0AAD7IGI6_9AGAR|nr:hypothetical protein B0H16DRAFT_1563109 [Mycena metata]